MNNTDLNWLGRSFPAAPRTALDHITGGSQWYGVFFELVEFGCPALLRREEITSDRDLDLTAIYSKGQEVNVVVRSIEGGKVNLALPRAQPLH